MRQRTLQRVVGIGGAVVSISLAFAQPAMADSNVCIEGSATVDTPIRNVAANASAIAMVGTEPYAFFALNGDPDGEIVRVSLDPNDPSYQTQTVSGVIQFTGAFVDTEGTGSGISYYTSNYSKDLYELNSTATTLTDVGAVSSDKSVYPGSISGSGVVYLGTNPSGELVQYDTTTGEFTELGSPDSTEKFVRDTAVLDGMVYLAMGTATAEVYSYAPGTETFTNLDLPSPWNTATGATEVQGVKVDGNDYLFVRTHTEHAGDPNTFVYDVADATWTELMCGTGVACTGQPSDAFSTPDVNGYVWFRDNITGEGYLHGYNPSTGDQIDTTEAVPATAFGMGLITIPGSSDQVLAMSTYAGKVYEYDVTNPGSVTEIDAVLNDTDHPAPAAKIRTVSADPVGRIWTSGYQSGGLAYYDTGDASTCHYPQGTAGQAESILYNAGDIYLGVYPSATLVKATPGADCTISTETEATISEYTSEDDPSYPYYPQARPFAMTAADNMIELGTVPTSGGSDGALTTWGRSYPYTLTVQGAHALASALANQSIVSLTTTTNSSGDHILIGGTSVAGGNGYTWDPSARANLFAYDLNTSTMVWSGLPSELSNALAISELITTPDGTIWGLTLDQLFELDPTDGSVLESVSLTSGFDWSSLGATALWSHGTDMGVLSDGEIWINDNPLGQLYFVDVSGSTPSVRDMQAAEGPMAVGTDGNLYYGDNELLEKMTLGSCSP
jgi:hypothetical protein